MNIRFCVPGSPGIPAGVHTAGVWAAIVMDKGTVVQAWDANGNLIKEVVSGIGPTEFFGFHSSVPIHLLRIIPIPEIDPNYTIDDLIFDTPKSVDGAGVEKFTTVRFRNGDRLVCTSMVIEGDKVTLTPAMLPKNSISASLGDLRAIHTPLGGEVPAFGDQSFWVSLSDGSQLVATSADSSLVVSRFPELTLQEFHLHGVWGLNELGRVPTEEVEWPEDKALMLDANRFVPITVSGLGKTWLDASGIARGPDEILTYADSPVVWMQPPSPIPPKTGALRFHSGEMLNLAGKSGFRLNSVDHEAVIIERGEHSWKIPLGSIASVQLPEAP